MLSTRQRESRMNRAEFSTVRSLPPSRSLPIVTAVQWATTISPNIQRRRLCCCTEETKSVPQAMECSVLSWFTPNSSCVGVSFFFFRSAECRLAVAQSAEPCFAAFALFFFHSIHLNEEDTSGDSRPSLHCLLNNLNCRASCWKKCFAI